MKLVLFGGVAAIAGAGFWMHGAPKEADVYAMPISQAYEKLAALKVEPANRGPFGRLDTTVYGTGGDTVTFDASGAHAQVSCTAKLSQVDAGTTRVAASCGGSSPSSGAAAGLEATMRRNRFIELVDATLDGRAYDVQLAQGATAARWPEDVIDHGDFGDAVREAHKMSEEMHRMTEESARAVEATGSGDGWGPAS